MTNKKLLEIFKILQNNNLITIKALSEVSGLSTNSILNWIDGNSPHETTFEAYQSAIYIIIDTQIEFIDNFRLESKLDIITAWKIITGVRLITKEEIIKQSKIAYTQVYRLTQIHNSTGKTGMSQKVWENFSNSFLNLLNKKKELLNDNKRKGEIITKSA